MMTKKTCGRAISTTVLAAATLVGSLAIAAPAFAQDAEATSDFEISGNAGIFSQYRWRGISLSDEEVAFQGGIDVAHSSGFYVGTWGSSLAGWGSYGGANAEIDVYAGYAGEAAGFGYDIGAIWYLYPGTSGTDVIELTASLSKELGPVGATVGVAYAPDQDSLGDDSLYLYTDWSAGIPNTPISLNAHLGYTDGGLSIDQPFSTDGDYLDWSIGASVSYDKLTLGVSYVDTDVKGGDPTINTITDSAIVVSLTAAF
jgi:uncharacterized protein (TIGR02001 family)